VNARRVTNKILTLLCLSATYSLDVDKLRQELNWDEAKQGNFHHFLCSLLKNDGKQLFGLTVSGGDFRVHLIKDIYLNAVSQKLRAYYDKHYKTSKELLTVEMMRRFLYWDCSTRQFKDFLVNHGMSKLLTPPTVQIAEGSAISDQPRHFRPQIVRSATHLLSVLTFVKQQYNLVSVICYGGNSAPEGQPRISLMRLTQANKQVLLIDVIALVDEARKQWSGPPEKFDIHQAEFVNQLSGLLSSEEIRKCVWDFKENVRVWLEDFGIIVRGLIDLFPVVSYFFPELLTKTSGEDDGFPCPRIVAETLAPQCWKAQDFFQSLPVRNWHVRPLTQPMVIRAAMIGVGALLDIRKGVRTELSSRVNEKMTQVSEMYYANPSDVGSSTQQDLNGKTTDLAKLLSPGYMPPALANVGSQEHLEDHDILGTPVLQGFGRQYSDGILYDGNVENDTAPDFLSDNADPDAFDLKQLLHQLDTENGQEDSMNSYMCLPMSEPYHTLSFNSFPSGSGSTASKTTTAAKRTISPTGSDSVGNTDDGPDADHDQQHKPKFTLVPACAAVTAVQKTKSGMVGKTFFPTA
jgi:hypothetical protein